MGRLIKYVWKTLCPKSSNKQHRVLETDKLPRACTRKRITKQVNSPGTVKGGQEGLPKLGGFRRAGEVIGF